MTYKNLKRPSYMEMVNDTKHPFHHIRDVVLSWYVCAKGEKLLKPKFYNRLSLWLKEELEWVYDWNQQLKIA